MASRPATPKQLRLLRHLAATRGVTFAIPESSAEASRQIERLLARAPQSRTERSWEERVAGSAPERGDAARVRPDEITGWGSSARWR
jgi:hypothetical protein